VIIVYAVAAAIRNRDAVLLLVLAGVVIGALFGAGVGLLKYLADPYNQLPAITFWLLGSLAAANLRDLANLLPAVAIGLMPLALLRWRIDVMTLGEEEATALGINTRTLRVVVIAGATLMTSAAVAASGIIGWVGLRRASPCATGCRTSIHEAFARQRVVWCRLSARRRYGSAHDRQCGATARSPDRGARHAGIFVASRL
jgi:ABC-type enterobactin transport system permease subunit